MPVYVCVCVLYIFSVVVVIVVVIVVFGLSFWLADFNFVRDSSTTHETSFEIKPRPLYLAHLYKITSN